ncbi:uncharacterized protein PHACADRAFT_207614 [Phanerochaete carnosa HHB-10118-sp]|uniref:Uncharacterized protein n=1 Tax=Phanerochaete carnosa (strain HHB-10118-sp) TaxID=650164 RepID=K5WAZ4_PHACS|nr:uncharacterized protein PHACADRAFT_207614 [Phanerochaete carnosa HHB-10118-sp]EKM56360.1 hypothetical protein PHACADRAFT_207614 [Phanerochaete carnosa HHB-10118-sp]
MAYASGSDVRDCTRGIIYVCAPLFIVNTLAFLALTAVIAVFSALRVYALWHGSRIQYIFPAIVLMLGLVPVGTNIFGWVHTVAAFLDNPPFTSCEFYINVPPKLNSDVIAADVLVLVLTWTKSFKQFQDMRRLKLGTSISAVLLRDGTVYFITLLATNTLQLLTYSSASFHGSFAEVFIQLMPAILVQRFMLNLRQLGHTSGEISSDPEPSSRLSMNFRVPSDFLGNIGEPLDYSQSEKIHEDGDITTEDQHEESTAETPCTDWDNFMEAGVAPASRSTEHAGDKDSTGSPSQDIALRGV